MKTGDFTQNPGSRLNECSGDVTPTTALFSQSTRLESWRWVVNSEHLDALVRAEYDCHRWLEWRTNILQVSVRQFSAKSSALG
jgi:hypothetical protein